MPFDNEPQAGHEYHPVFGRLDDLDPVIIELGIELEQRLDREMQWVEAALATIGTDAETPPYPFAKPRALRVISPEPRGPFQPQIRTDDSGTWDLLPPGTSPQSGDEIEDEGVWRLRPLTKPRSTSPSDVYGFTVIRASQARQVVEDMELRGVEADDPDLIRAREELEACNAERSSALKVLAEWERREPVIETTARKAEWTSIDANRQTPTGRAERNSKRRAPGRGPNADLSMLTPEERAEHRRQQKAANKRDQRARQKAQAEAEAEAAQNGDLAAAINA